MNLHKFFGTIPDDGIQPKEIITYSIAGFGQNLICALISSFLMIFYTDAVGLAASGVAYLMLFARVFDASNDPIMGSIVDRTHTRWGKLRPYMLFTPIPIAILTVICFTTLPNASYNMRFIYASITYVIWSIIYTIIDVPYWGLSTAMTSNTNIRSTLLTVARLFCTAGGGLVTLVIPIITGMIKTNWKNGGSNNIELLRADYQTAFFWIAIVIVILATPLFFIGFKGTKERFYEEGQIRSLKENLKLLFKNKPLMMVVLSGILGSIKCIYLSSCIYFAKYNLNNEGLASLFMILVVPGGLIASITTPYFIKKFGKKNVYIYTHLFGAAILFLMYFIGYGNGLMNTFGAWFSLIGLVLLGIPSGFANILSYAMIADTVDYLEFKTGERAEGICFAMQTFMSKIGMAMSAFTILITLSIVGFQENVFQSSMSYDFEKVKKGIYFSSIFLAGVSMLLTTIPMFFYNITEKEQARIVAITKERKAAAKKM